MDHMLHGCAVVGQSGGPTAAINATLAGVIRGAYNAEEIDTLYGMRNGIEGLLKESLIDLTARFTAEDGALDTESLEDLIHTPAAALGSCRKKLPAPINANFLAILSSDCTPISYGALITYSIIDIRLDCKGRSAIKCRKIYA